MGKQSLLYVSPMGPMKSGIADYSEALVSALQKKYDITLYIDNYELSNPNLRSQCKIVRHGCDEIDFENYDYIIYNIGNNPEYHGYIYEACLKHPGMVILHDLVLYYLFVGYYQSQGIFYSKLYQEEGLENFIKIKKAVKESHTNLLEQKKLAEYFPLNNEIIKSENKIMVHSWYSYNKVLASRTDRKESIAKINSLIEQDSNIILRDILFEKYHIPKDALIVSSFGFVASTKMNHIVCEVIKQLSAETELKICYVMVGEGDYVNDYVDGKAIIKTGYVDLDEFNSFIEYSDLIVNLRNPSMGETSAAMLRILQRGKACVTNDGGWFSELPKECVIKVKLDRLLEELKDKIKYYLEHSQDRAKIGENARMYIIQEYDSDKIVQQIGEFLT